MLYVVFHIWYLATIRRLMSSGLAKGEVRAPLRVLPDTATTSILNRTKAVHFIQFIYNPGIFLPAILLSRTITSIPNPATRYTSQSLLCRLSILLGCPNTVQTSSRLWAFPKPIPEFPLFLKVPDKALLLWVWAPSQTAVQGAAQHHWVPIFTIWTVLVSVARGVKNITACLLR